MAGFGTPPVSPLPVVGVDIGPVWASKVNAGLSELQAIVTPPIGGPQINLGTDGELKHGPRTIRMGISSAAAVVGAAPTTGTIPVEFRQAAAGTDEVSWDIALADNDRLLEVSVFGEVAVST